jgi:AcrR family transcriptional regulator
MFASEADGSKRGPAGPVEAAATFARNLRQSGHAATRDWRVRTHGATGFRSRRRSRWYRRDGHVRSRGVDEPHNDTRRSEVGRAGAGCLGRPADRDTRMLVRPSDEQRHRREHGRDRQRQAQEQQPRPDRRAPAVPLLVEVPIATLEVLDADGLDELSMRHVGRTLNSTAGALYWHVGSKDGLLDLILDRVIGEQEVPDPEPERWREQVKEIARTMRATILGHRDVVRLSIGRIPMGPHALRYAERVLAILRAGGLPDALAVAGHQLLISIVIGFCIDETGEGGRPPAEQPPPQAVAAMARDYLAALPADRFPNLVDLADHHADADADQRFELLLGIFVDGLAQRAAS